MRKRKSDIELAHRKPCRESVAFGSDRERAAFRVADEVACLVPLLPSCVIFESMLRGERGTRQVPDPAEREAQLERMLGTCAGTDGASIQQVRPTLRDAREHGAREHRLVGDALNAALVPTSVALAHA